MCVAAEFQQKCSNEDIKQTAAVLFEIIYKSHCLMLEKIALCENIFSARIRFYF